MGQDTPRAPPPHDEARAHGTTQAEGQGSPGGLRGLAGHGTPSGEVPIAPPKASLGSSEAAERVWSCCGVDWGSSAPYDAHLRSSHGGNALAQEAPGGSGQGEEPARQVGIPRMPPAD